MKVLLDTHALLWALSDDDRLSAGAREITEDLQHEILVSTVSGWEIAIKRALGKLEAPLELGKAVEEAGFIPRPPTFVDCERLSQLPLHHRDAFDRMLVAQALVDGIPIISRDATIGRYGVQILW